MTLACSFHMQTRHPNKGLRIRIELPSLNSGSRVFFPFFFPSLSPAKRAALVEEVGVLLVRLCVGEDSKSLDEVAVGARAHARYGGGPPRS